MNRIVVAIAIASVWLTASAAFAGSDPAAACKSAKAKAAGKKAGSLLKAAGKNIKKPNPLKLGADVSKAQSKFSKSFTKAEGKGGCETTGDVGAIEAKVDAFVDDAIGDIAPASVCGNDVIEVSEECDGSDDAACDGLCQVNCQCPAPTCANGVLEAGEECDPPCSTGQCGGGEVCSVDCTCVPDVPCNCGSPDPTTLEFASVFPNNGVGICGAVKDGDGITLFDVDCAQGYIGGGDIGVDPLQPVHIGTETVYNVECCYGTTVAIRGTTPADTGSSRNCSSLGCTQGGPNPVPMTVAPFSTCVVENIDATVTGSVDCSTGEVLLREPIRTTIFLSGDLLTDRCNGGANPGGFCQDDSDCTPGGTCDDDGGVTQPCPICNTSTFLCNGGANDGLPCTPETADLGDPYPTSYDCPPPPEDEFGFTYLPHVYTTDALSQTTTDGQFCTFCRDLVGETSGCFEGDPANTCPDSAAGPCKPGLGETAECGTGTRCETDADCFPPFETCTQRSPGALDFPDGRAITNTGTPAGDVTDRLPHEARLSAITCIPPTFIGFQDSTADFPGPGTFSLVGDMQLKP
jgi:hypothetical protein